MNGTLDHSQGEVLETFSVLAIHKGISSTVLRRKEQASSIISTILHAICLSVISLLLLSQSPELYQGVIDDCGSVLISIAELAPIRTVLFLAELPQP